jgi:GntR family phosphonate transport system transcriptional regulator
MGRTAVWTAIRDTLGAEIAAGQYPPGDKLPTEAALAARFGVNRHTVRRALAALAQTGVVAPRRGAGVFVAARPTDYPIGARVRYHQNLHAAGRLPGKQVLTIETRRADTREAAALGLAPGSRVHCYDGVSLADHQPLALFRSVFPAGRFAGLPERLLRLTSVTAALREEGVADFTRKSTRVSAHPADAAQATHLRLAQGAPLLRTNGINVDPEGRPVEYGITWFAADRVTLTFEG